MTDFALSWRSVKSIRSEGWLAARSRRLQLDSSMHVNGSGETNKQHSFVFVSELMYVLASVGGQYDCGTTDVTRTFHLGEPTAYEKTCFTRVLQVQSELLEVALPRVQHSRPVGLLSMSLSLVLFESHDSF